MPQALRLQGILMGGVVIIYSRQTHFLLEDCKDVMVRQHLGFVVTSLSCWQGVSLSLCYCIDGYSGEAHSMVCMHTAYQIVQMQQLAL